MKTEPTEWKIGDEVALGGDRDATVYRVTEVSYDGMHLQIAAPYGRAAPRWVGKSQIRQATAQQKQDPHNQPGAWSQR